MAAIQGYSGKVLVGTSEIMELSSWELEIEADDLDVTDFESGGWTEIIPGLRSWSGKVEGSWDVATSGSNQSTLQNAILNATSITLKLYANATNYYSGTAYITKFKIDTPVDDKVSIELEFKGTGALTYT